MDAIINPLLNHNSNQENLYFSPILFNELNENRLDDLYIIHQNIRSFNKNIDELEVFLQQLNSTPDIVILSETWFNDENIAILPGYIDYHSYRRNRPGGGISVYIRDHFNSTLIPDFTTCDEVSETVAASITLNSSYKIAILGIYRPPVSTNLPQFNLRFNEFMNKLSKFKCTFIAGDFNIDLSEPNVEETTFITNCKMNSYVPIITTPTRIVNNSISLLDHIWTNNVNASNDSLSGVFNTEITDHYIVFTKVNLDIAPNIRIQKKFRDHSNLSLLNFKNSLNDYLLNFPAQNYSNINEKTEHLCKSLQDIYDHCCPIRCKTISIQRIKKPWITDELIDAINTKHELFRQMKRGNIEYTEYNSFKNRVTHRLRFAKRMYYHHKFNQCMGNIKKTWNLSNSLIRNKKRSSEIVLNVNDRETKDPTVTSNAFNEYFTNIARELDSNIPQNNKSPSDYMNTPNLCSFFASPATQHEVLSTINSFPNKSCNILDIPVYIFKITSDILSTTIMNLFNETLYHGVFPDNLKIARVVPIFKAGDKRSVKNYRPISVLPFISKLFERMMYKRLISYINKMKILTPTQFGFRQKSCTSDAVIEALDNVYTSLDNRETVIAVFLDFSKAFDTVNHDILLSKLSQIGIRGRMHHWFSSYLSNRKQCVVINNISSHYKTITMGVPQGSILGPILFLLYINDMSNCYNDLKFIHFADDTTVFSTSPSYVSAVEKMNYGLTKIDEWLQANRLSLNISKTSYMIFSDLKMLPEINLQIRGESITKVNKAKFLGIYIDQNLSFKTHTDHLRVKLSQAIGSIRRISYLLPDRIRLNLYYSLIYSHLSYGILAWGRSSVANENRIASIHKRALNVLNLSCTRHKLLNFHSIYDCTAVTKLYKVLHLQNHLYYYGKLMPLIPQHNRQTRAISFKNFNTPFFRKSKSKKSFIYQAIKTWNNLTITIKDSKSLPTFKKSVKQFLLNCDSLPLP